MGCACKVTQYVNKVNRRYGNKFSNRTKTNITEIVKTAFKKVFYGLICLPLIPFMLIYIIFHKVFSKRPISIDKIFKIG